MEHSEGDSSNGHNTFLILLHSDKHCTLYDICQQKAILKTHLYSAPNIKKNTENMYNIYAKYLTNLGPKRTCCTSQFDGCIVHAAHVFDRWGLNFAFYLRCSHIGQQRMNLRQDIIKGNESGVNYLSYNVGAWCFLVFFFFLVFTGIIFKNKMIVT